MTIAEAGPQLGIDFKPKDPRRAAAVGYICGIIGTFGLTAAWGGVEELVERTNPSVDQIAAEARDSAEVSADAEDDLLGYPSELPDCNLLLQDYGPDGKFGSVTEEGAIADIMTTAGVPCGTDRHAVREMLAEYDRLYADWFYAQQDAGRDAGSLESARANAKDNDILESVETMWHLGWLPILAGLSTGAAGYHISRNRNYGRLRVAVSDSLSARTGQMPSRQQITNMTDRTLSTLQPATRRKINRYYS